jgi:hypothetical protein
MHGSLCRCPLTFRGPLASIHLATMPTSNYRPYHLLGLEEEDGTVTQIEVDEMFRLVRDEAAKVPSHNAVPGWTLPFVERSLDVLRNVLLDCEFGHCLLSDIDGLLLHVFGHVCRLNLGF